MNDPFLMGVLDGPANLNEQFQALTGGKSLFITVVRDFDTTHQFHDEVRSASVGCSGIQHLGDIRMIHQRQGLAFGLETRDHLLGIHAQFDDLERHALTHRFCLLRHIDDPTAAFANLLKEFVAAYPIARFFGGHLAGRNDPNCGRGRGVWSGWFSCGQTKLKQTGNTMPTRSIGWQFGVATRTFMRFTHTLFRSKADAQGRVVQKAAGFSCARRKTWTLWRSCASSPQALLMQAARWSGGCCSAASKIASSLWCGCSIRWDAVAVYIIKRNPERRSIAPSACPTGSYCAGAVFFPASALSNSASFIFQSAALSDWPVAS